MANAALLMQEKSWFHNTVTKGRETLTPCHNCLNTGFLMNPRGGETSITTGTGEGAAHTQLTKEQLKN